MIVVWRLRGAIVSDHEVGDCSRGRKENIKTQYSVFLDE